MEAALRLEAIATRSKDATNGAKGIATSNKCLSVATNGAIGWLALLGDSALLPDPSVLRSVSLRPQETCRRATVSEAQKLEAQKTLVKARSPQ